jgi:valyl-tRNA synthetase
MPFITEEIAGGFRKFTHENEEFLIRQRYPAADNSFINDAAEKEMSAIQAITSEIRRIRAQFNVPPALKIKVILSTADKREKEIINKYSDYIISLAKIEELIVDENLQAPRQSATAVFGNTAIYVPLEGLIDFDKENARLAKELFAVQAGIANRERMLSNENFVKNAPAEQAAKAKEELNQMRLKAEQIKAAMEGLK